MSWTRCVAALVVGLGVSVIQAESGPPAAPFDGHTFQQPVDGYGVYDDGSCMPARTIAVFGGSRELEPVWTVATAAPVLTPTRLADVTGDGIDEIIVTTYYPDPNNPYQGGVVHVLNLDGQYLLGWPKEVLPGPFAGGAAVADLDGDGDGEIVAGNWYKAFVWNHDGTNYPGWPKNYGTYDVPTLADLDNDDDYEIIYSRTNKTLYVWHHDGTSFSGWPYVAPDSVNSPCVADLDGDGEMELAAGTSQGPVGSEPFEVYVWEADGTVKTGFPVDTSGVVKAALALGDIDADGEIEIVACAFHISNNDYIHVWEADGSVAAGWPRQATYARLSAPALGDLDGDGDLEIVVGGMKPAPFDEMLFAFHHDGSTVDGWPVELHNPSGSSNPNSSPLICDIDGDPAQVEVLLKVNDHLYALHGDGTLVDGFPYYFSDAGHTGTYSPTPAVGDPDADGQVELVYVTNNGTIAYFELETPFDPTQAYWRQFKHDACGTGYYPAAPELCAGDLNCDGAVDFDDIDPFVAALGCQGGDPNCWDPACPWLNGDCDDDGTVDFDDIDPFVARIGATCP